MSGGEKRGRKWQREPEKVCVRESAGSLETVFLGIKDLLSAERAEAKTERERENKSGLKRRMDMANHFKRLEWKRFCPCHFNLGLESMSQWR